MTRRVCCIVAATTALLAGPAAAQLARRLDPDRTSIILRDVEAHLRRHYYDTTFHGIDLAERFRVAGERARAATNNRQIFAAIAQVLSELDDSHTTFWPPDRVADVRYGWRPYLIGDSCFIVAVERGSDAERRGVRVGDRLLAVDGMRPTRRDLWRIKYILSELDPRASVTLRLAAPGEAPRELVVAARVRPRQAVVDLTGRDGGLDIWDLIRASEDWWANHREEYVTVGDTTLVWRLPTFAVENADLDEGVSRARRHRTLILDLRGNTGGYERAVLHLIAATFEGPVEVGTLRRRSGNERIHTRARLDPYAGRIIVLVDSRSASASEIYAGTVQRLGRGTVIGDRTDGAVQRARVYPLQAGGATSVLYSLAITDADIVLGDSLRLEHRGLTPDELILPSQEDLTAGRDPALARALQLAGHQVDAAGAGRILRREWRRFDLW